ncbi:hypothetical protein F4804DRAFT_261267 [Jackrogersella minutella]|nr:hypothetical protein F4804DRAFT_261267 [Jackrogersella minutella]
MAADQQVDDSSIRTQTIVWPASTFVTTWTLGDGGSDSTEPPATVVPASNPGSSGSQNVGPILSGVVVLLVLILVVWFCCRRSRSNNRGSRRSSRRRGSSYASKGGSSGSGSSNGSSRDDPSDGSAASEVADDQWNQQEPIPDGPMPAMPPPAAGGWPGPHQDPGMGPMPPAPAPGPGPGPGPGMGMGFFPGRGGLPQMMARGGPLPLGRGGPPPMMGRGGPPPGVM